MGREIKRVALDFDWPLGMPWKGYINPYTSQKCKACDGSGYNPVTKQISDDWYAFDDRSRMWCNSITQAEVDELIAKNRLYDFTHRFVPGKGWTKIEPAPVVTAEQVNKWSRGGMGHDSINKYICVEFRAKSMGVFGYCPICDGDGEIWFNDKIEELSENWYKSERYDPPSGDGWQVWETVSEGSPVTPVLPTKEALIDYLIQNGDAWDQKRGDCGWDPEAAKIFVEREWAPSLLIITTADVSKFQAPRDLGE